jgi:hypothetical protein
MGICGLCFLDQSNEVILGSYTRFAFRSSMTLMALSHIKMLQYFNQFQSSIAGEDAKPLFLAIASAPTGTAKSEADAAAGEEEAAVPATWEFLVKKTGVCVCVKYMFRLPALT